jgi:hypothetical protein
MKIKLDPEDRERILKGVERCYLGIIQGIDSEDEIKDLYVGSVDGSSFDEAVEVEFASLYEVFSDVFDGVLAHAVRAREFAFTRISGLERAMDARAFTDAQWLNHNFIFPGKSAPSPWERDEYDDPFHIAGYTQAQIEAKSVSPAARRAVRSDIERKLDTLTINCVSPASTKSITHEGALLGTYSEDDNTISIYPFSINLSVKVGRPTSAYVGVAAHAFLHEITHMLEPCRGLAFATLKRNIQNAGILTPRMEIAKSKEILEKWKEMEASYYYHCTRFRLTLLYLSYRLKFVRASLFEQIEKELIESNPVFFEPGEEKLKKDGTPYKKRRWIKPPRWGTSTPDLSTPAKRRRATYSWEKRIKSESLKDMESGKRPLFVAKSFVESTENLMERLTQLDTVDSSPRPNFKRGPAIFETLSDSDEIDASILVSPEGFTNLYLDSSDVDPFALLESMLSAQVRRHASAITIDTTLPFIGVLDDSDSLIPIYCDGNGEFIVVTLEEMWWILAS